MRSLAWSRCPWQAAGEHLVGKRSLGKRQRLYHVRLERTTPTPCREAVRRGASVETLATPMWKLVRRI
jgi:hypothetical protein